MSTSSEPEVSCVEEMPEERGVEAFRVSHSALLPAAEAVAAPPAAVPAAAPTPPPAAAPAVIPAAPAPPAAAAEDPFLAVCRWFDRECAGYLRAEDVEEILLHCCDFLSRARPALLSHGPACFLCVVST